MIFFLLTMQYFLKARFGFDKNQFADLMLLITIVGSISQVITLLVIICLNNINMNKFCTSCVVKCFY